MNCYRTSNNKFFNAPPRMDDARHFTDYRPNCMVNNMLRNNNEIFNSFDYRLFLARNAEHIMESNRKHAFNKNGVSECKKPYEVGTMLPEQTKVVCNKTNCKRVENDPAGLGEGRVYSEDPESCISGFKSAPLELTNNKCTPPQDNFNYYPNSNIQGANFARQVVPSGGQMLSGGDPSEYQ